MKMDVETFTFYQMGKTVGRSLGCSDLAGLTALLRSLELGQIQVENGPVFRVYNACILRSSTGGTQCFFQAGLIAGALESVWRQEVDVEETSCAGLGDNYCEFRVNPSPRGFFQLPAWEANQGAGHKAMVKDLVGRQVRWLAEKYAAERERRGLLGKTTGQLDSIWGVSDSTLRLKNLAERAARSDFTVLLQGESGTGKELFAQAIHAMSRRADKPLVSVNCAAIPDSLLEAEFFGYEEGSFTGAKKGGKPGKFEQADQGTIFLDEIGDMPLVMQAKLLRVLQYGEIQKLGGTAHLRVNVRLIAATNRDLTRMAEEKLFREDLFYRLNVIRLEIPPLRERPEDIPVLARKILERLNQSYPGNEKEIAPQAMEKLSQYVWPGNIRELQNIMERLFSLVESKVIGAEDLDTFLPGNWATRHGFENKSLRNSLWEIERELILEAIAAAGGNKSKAAKILGLPRSSFYEKLKQYDLI